MPLTQQCSQSGSTVDLENAVMYNQVRPIGPNDFLGRDSKKSLPTAYCKLTVTCPSQCVFNPVSGGYFCDTPTAPYLEGVPGDPRQPSIESFQFPSYCQYHGP